MHHSIRLTFIVLVLSTMTSARAHAQAAEPGAQPEQPTAAQPEQPAAVQPPPATPAPPPAPAPSPPPPPQPSQPPLQPPQPVPVEQPEPVADVEPQYPVFVPKARLIMGTELRKEHPADDQVGEDNRQPFFIEQARIGFDMDVNDAFSLEFSAELTDSPVVRDAYVNVKIEREFQIQAGHFKRPISRIENTSTGKLPFRDRGLFNRVLLRQGNWGNRALGVMLWGKLRSPDLRWYAAVMNAAETPDVRALEQMRGADFLGRVEYAPAKWIEIGLNGGHKIMEPYVGGPNLELFAFGGDVRVRADRLRLVVESIAAQNPSPPAPRPAGSGSPFAANVIGYATYEVPLADEVALEPTLAGEWVDTDLEYQQDEALRGLAGLNFLFFDSQLRVMPQVEVVRPLGDVSARSQVKRETYYLLLSTEL